MVAANIVHVVQHLQPGGIETLALEIARVTKQADIHILSLEGDKATTIDNWPRLKPFSDQLTFLDKPEGWSIGTLHAVSRYLKSLNPIAVHTHHIGPLIYGGIGARLAGIQQRLHTEHDAWHLQNTKRRWLQHAILKWVKPTIIADSKAVSNALQNFFPWQAQTLIYNGIDTDKFAPGDQTSARATLNLPNEATIIGCAARLEHVKGQDVLIRALAELPENFIAVFAGQGSKLSEYRALAQTLNVEKRVHFIGNLDNMDDFYRAIDLFCLPSRNEGLPLSPLEAQACGKPALATNVGGCNEAICPQTGKLVEAENPIAMAEAITALLSQPMQRSPRQFVLNNFSLLEMSKKYFELASQVDGTTSGCAV